MRGKLSKGMVESILQNRTHSDILNAMNELEKKGRIRKQGCKFGSGRKQFYYKITEKGLTLLICDNPHPLKFWKAMFGFCHHNNGKISFATVKTIYKFFMDQYRKYPGHGFLSQLEIFDNMRDKWLREFVLKKKIISLEQKVIEVLAVYPKITLEELAKKTRESKSEVIKVLDSYTFESYTPLGFKDKYYTDQNLVGKKHNKRYWDFMLHNIVRIVINNDSVKVFELSLYGIMLALSVLRYNDMGKLKHGLFYSTIIFPDYFSKISNNYQSKLPLIFGKWDFLKGILRVFTAYNFDIILDKNLRIRDSDNISIIRGGNKELHDGIKEIILQTRLEIGDFANAGQVVWLNYIAGVTYEYEGLRNQYDNDYLINNNIDVQTKPDQQKVIPLKNMLEVINILLNPVENFYSKESNMLPEKIDEIAFPLEDLFADEITALYYIHLYYDHPFYTRISEPAEYYTSSIDSSDQFPLYQRPKECLMSILNNDKDKPLLGEWFYKWTQDLVNLQKVIYENLKSIL